MSIRRRVALGVGISTIALVAVASIALVAWLHHALGSSVDAGLRVRGDEAAAAIESSKGAIQLPERQFAGRADGYFQVVQREGPVARSGLTGSALRDARRGISLGQDDARALRTVHLDHARVRTLAFSATTASGRPVVVVVGASLKSRDDALSALQTALLVGAPLLGLLVIAAALSQLDRPLRAVRTIGEEAERIRRTDDPRRISQASSVEEIDALASTLNDMLDRLRDATARQRRFVAVASHEFRTPLATLKAQADALEMQLAGALDTSSRHALGSIHDELDRLVQVADTLLLLTEQESGSIRIQRGRVELERMLDGVANRFAARAELAGRGVQVDASAPTGTIHVDRVLLEQSLGNLIDNALRHGRGVAMLHATLVDERLSMWVADAGPGLDAGLAAELFEPFSGAGSSTGGAHRGAGLGLSIVRAVARAHGGDCTLQNCDGSWYPVIEIPVADVEVGDSSGG